MIRRCAHYRCLREDVQQVAYFVLGQTFARWLCPAHAPPGPRASGD